MYLIRNLCEIYSYADDNSISVHGKNVNDIVSKIVSVSKVTFDICADFAVSNCIIFNEKRTKCMCFKQPNSLNSLFVPTLCLNGVPLTFVTTNV